MTCATYRTFFPWPTRAARTANELLAQAGVTDGEVRMRESKAATLEREAYDVIHRAPGEKRGRAIFTMVLR